MNIFFENYVNWFLGRFQAAKIKNVNHNHKRHLFSFSNKQTFSIILSQKLVNSRLILRLEMAVNDDKLLQTKKKIQTDMFTFTCLPYVTRIKIKRFRTFYFEHTNVFKFQNIDHIDSHICVRIATFIVAIRLFQLIDTSFRKCQAKNAICDDLKLQKSKPKQNNKRHFLTCSHKETFWK